MAKSKQQLVCRIDNGLEIWADANQYILRRDKNPNKDSYYSDLEMVIQDIFELKAKEYAMSAKNKDLESLGEAIRKAEEYIKKVINPVLNGYRRPPPERDKP